MSRLNHGPTRLSSLAAGLLGFVAVVTSGYFSWTALALGSAGLLALVIALVRASYRLTSLGAVGMILASVATSLGGVPAWSVLMSVVGAVVAGDAARTAISVGNQLGRNAKTSRLESVRLVSSIGVGIISVVIGYGLYLFAEVDQPTTAIVFLVIAAVLLMQALR